MLYKLIIPMALRPPSHHEMNYKKEKRKNKRRWDVLAHPLFILCTLLHITSSSSTYHWSSKREEWWAVKVGYYVNLCPYTFTHIINPSEISKLTHVSVQW